MCSVWKKINKFAIENIVSFNLHIPKENRPTYPISQKPTFRLNVNVYRMSQIGGNGHMNYKPNNIKIVVNISAIFVQTEAFTFFF